MKAEIKRVWFIMVHHPVEGWMRAGKAYGSKESATGWVQFVSRAWKGLRTKVEPCDLTYVDFKMDAESVKILSDKFNMDPPDEKPDKESGES